MGSKKTIDKLAKIFGDAAVEVLSNSSGADIYFAPTVQKVDLIYLKPDIGTFVQFRGDYSGLVIVNFTKEAAMEYYRMSMLNMGFPAEELAIDHTADDVVDSIGESVNQLIGKARQMIQEEYGLSSYNNQPKAVCLMESILLSINTMIHHKPSDCRRLSFRISGRHTFHIEMFIEQTEFIILDPERLKAGQQKSSNRDLDIDAMMDAEKADKKEKETVAATNNLDIEALLNANR
ncbi:MAG: DUF3334 family protein [SAR324 cluster bacterium]|nr:DUF3334 family protein [SAR324 cluster bacterium]